MVIVAAGQGSRLGLGPKAFVRLEGQTLLERVARAANEAGFSRVVAVLPPGYECPVPDLQWTVNSEPESGALGSLLAALHAPGMGEGVTELVSWPVDHPWVTAPQIEALRRAASEVPPDVARGVPRWEGRRGHPVWVCEPGVRRLRSVTSALDGTLREHLAAAGTTREVEALDGSVLRNLNERHDWEATGNRGRGLPPRAK